MSGIEIKGVRRTFGTVRAVDGVDLAIGEGEFFTLTEARCVPKPVQARLPIWVGGGGERVTLRIAAQHADGWNIPYVSPETFAHKCRVLDEHCARVGRDPADILRTVNVGFARREEDLVAQFGAIAEGARPGVLMGSDQEVVDRIGAYRDAGAQQLNLTMRAPFDHAGEFYRTRGTYAEIRCLQRPHIPVYGGASFGHIRLKFTLPVGLPVEMDADAGTLRFLQPAVS